MKNWVGMIELVQVPEILTENQLLSIWYEIGAIPWCSGSQKLYSCHSSGIHLCVRVDKGNTDYLKPSTNLCTGCHYFIPSNIPCSNINNILSVQVAKDLLRFGRALTWLLNIAEVTDPDH